jgi:tRNA threonylcarbamoyladenosine biosynthesis protein TsaE
LKKASFTCRTSSGEETIRLGQRCGACLQEGDVVALAGELGSGKTWFTKGLALGLGVPREEVVTSPSFALLNVYEGRCTLFHMDVYRLGSTFDFLDAGLDDYLNRSGVTVVEWADRWPELLPERRLEVRIEILDENARKITFSECDPKAVRILKEMEREVG